MSAIAIIFLCVGVVAIIFVIMYFYYNNREVALRKEAEAQRGKIAAIRDQMFKIIQEQGNVAADYRESFGKIFPEIISGRYKDGGSLMKFIQEANPHFETSLYRQLANSIEVQRGSFTSAQTRMLDIINQRAALLEYMPSRWFIKDKSPIEYNVIQSSDTRNVIETATDDYTFSFGNK